MSTHDTAGYINLRRAGLLNSYRFDWPTVSVRFCKLNFIVRQKNWLGSKLSLMHDTKQSIG